MDLSIPLTSVKGVGPKTAAQLARAGLHTLRDLIYYFPRDYENFAAPTALADVKPGKLTVKATVEDAKTRYVRARLSITEATLRDPTGAIRAAWFNQPYRAKQFTPGAEYYFFGEFTFSRGRYQLQNPSCALASDYDHEPAKFQPIYPQRAGLKPIAIKKLIAAIRPNLAAVPELYPPLGQRAAALYDIHFPESERDVATARQYLALEELFCLILAAQLNRQDAAKLRALPIPEQLDAIKAMLADLPFKLTNAQRRTAWEIIQDLAKPTPMNRLLQGDVGSGKTLVAALAALDTIRAGHQVALLAPTEILAQQHAASLHQALAGQDVEVALLTGSTKHKAALKQHIASGAVDLVVGTHALLTDDTTFRSLALAIIDEQHRFGVAQRQKLIAKSGAHVAPHLLAMTATPIPRSLQLTLFGDLDVSVIDQMPPGRTPVTTKLLTPQDGDILWSRLRAELDAEHQVYYICKAIDTKSDLKTVETEAAKLRDRLGSKHRVEILHGRMKADAKAEVMQDFVAGKIGVLVSTTVVEVGVDNPNATLIVIENADRYGLAQLHQLRGRVGRGPAASYCYLIASDGVEPGRRLKEVERSSDGFHLAAIDLELRGPGEIYGTLQHGVLDLNIASLSDTKTIAQAQKLAHQFLSTGQNVLQYPELAHAVHQYQKLTTLN
jgi:ATP-dependent DNA helicase RecG